MKDKDKTKEQMLNELEDMRQRVAELEVSEAERKQVEDKLRESAEKLSGILNNISDVVWSISWPDFTHHYFSPSLERLYGRSKQEFMDNPTLFKEVTHPDDQHLTEKAMKQLMEEGEATRECRIVRPDGSIVWVNDISKMIYDENHQPIRVEGVTQDITERKQAEEALQAAERNFRNSLDDSPLGIRIIDVDVEGITIYANRAILDIYGYSSIEEFKSIPAAERHTLQSYAKRRERVRKRKAGEPVPGRFEQSIIRKDGEVRHLEVFNREVLWGGKKQFQLIYHDITERKQAEEVLRDSEEKLRLMFASVNEGITITDLNGNVVGANEAVARMHCYDSKEQLIGRSVLELIAERDHAKAMENLKKTLEEGHSRILEYTLLREDGSEFPGELDTTLIRDMYGNPISFIAITRDITERKQAEETKTQFLNRLYHELNTPLTPILSSGSLLVEQLESKGEVEYRLARNILDGAHALSNRLNELLKLTKGEMGILKVTTEPLEPGSLIRRLAGRWSPTFPAKKQEFHLEVEGPLPYVLADEGRISQVLSNLLSNANKFTPEGGRVTLRAKAEVNTLVIEVEDNGPGIPPEKQAALFRPYPHSNSFPGSGLGLGLAISRRLIELQGGKIWYQGQPGKGSTFGFSLPLVRNEEQK